MGRCPYPQGGLRRILRPPLGAPDISSDPTAKGKNSEASAWHVEARLGDKLFNKPPSGYKWIPLDEAVWALGDADPLQLWRHLPPPGYQPNISVMYQRVADNTFWLIY